jgi:CheY-like chemotaxis protein
MTVVAEQLGNAPHVPLVVIADDDADIRRLVEVAAGRAGAIVGANVADGLAALEAIRELRPDLAILDVSMPGMDGLDVCRAVRAEDGMRSTKILLLSAAVHPEAIKAGRLAGADLYGQKPFRLKVLQEQILGLLSIQLSAR